MGKKAPSSDSLDNQLDEDSVDMGGLIQDQQAKVIGKFGLWQLIICLTTGEYVLHILFPKQWQLTFCKIYFTFQAI